jgi:pilus assembly protein Flp/PilA
MKNLLRFFRDIEAATAVEYCLMASLIAGAIVLAVGLLGQNLNELFNSFVSKYPH